MVNGDEGEIATKQGAKGGPGGYAGIHVPTGDDDSVTTDDATLNISGEGTIKCYGGKAGAGSPAVSGNTGGGRRRRRWCRNRGKWWHWWRW